MGGVQEMGAHGDAAIDRFVRFRSEADQALREGQGPFQGLIGHLREVLWVATAQMDRFVYVSPAYENLWGRSRIGLHEDPAGWLEATHPEDRRKLLRAMAASRRSGWFDHDWRLVHPDGSVRWVRAHAATLPERDDADRHMIGYALDITERKRAEQMGQESDKRYRDLLDNANDLIQSVSPEGLFLYVNRAWLRALQYEKTDLLTLSLFDVIHPECHEHCQALFERLMAGETIDRTEVTFVTRDGRRILLEGSMNPVIQDGRAIATRGIFREIDPQELTVHRTLEEMVVRATQTASEGELARQANGEMLANMSHELRTPMNGIIGMADLLRDTQLTETQNEYLELLARSARSMMATVSGLLEFAEIEAGRLTLDAVPFSLTALIERVTEPVAAAATQAGLGWSCTLAPDLPDRLIGDPARLEQILRNLLQNALAFTDAGQIDFRVASRSEEPRPVDEVRLQFTVSDTGIGIPKDRLETVFESFRQVDGSLTRRHQGHGLGLTISRRLVKMMGGQLWAESEPGQGSRFHLRICLPQPRNTPPK